MACKVASIVFLPCGVGEAFLLHLLQIQAPVTLCYWELSNRRVAGRLKVGDSVRSPRLKSSPTPNCFCVAKALPCISILLMARWYTQTVCAHVNQQGLMSCRALKHCAMHIEDIPDTFSSTSFQTESCYFSWCQDKGLMLCRLV